MALKASMNILLLDGDADNRLIVKKMLNGMGLKNITECGDGEKAWEILVESYTEDPVGLVISEYELPKVRGIELLEKVRADGKFAKLPFLMITGQADQQNVVTAVKAGVSNVVVKPFSAQTLIEKMRKIFGQK